MFSEIRYRLFAPWRYYTISEESNFILWLNWILPIVFSAFAMVILFYFPLSQELLKVILSSLLNILCIMPGFFITALSAVVVFQSDAMDKQMPGSKVTAYFDTETGGKDYYPLTRRRFLCMTFSFLAAQSLLLSFVVVIGKCLLCNDFLNVVLWGICPLLLLGCSQFLLITLHGLYYLGERLLNQQ